MPWPCHVGMYLSWFGPRLPSDAGEHSNPSPPGSGATESHQRTQPPTQRTGPCKLACTRRLADRGRRMCRLAARKTTAGAPPQLKRLQRC
jgi:hypothetical protein